MARAVGILRGEDCWGHPVLVFFFFLPMGESSSQGDTSWHLVWHAGTQIGSGVEPWGQTHVELLQCLGPRAQVQL